MSRGSMRFGLIGFGFMGGVHLSAITQIECATVTAVSSRTRPTSASASRGNLPQAQSAGLPPEVLWSADWRELLDNPEIDAVDICLPTNLHQEVAIGALERGKHVLCEKPMALTPAECDAILQAASKSGRIFMVGQVLRFMFPYRYAASFITSTLHHSVTACKFERKTGYPQWSSWLADEKSSGGAILDLLIHDIDQALKLFGPPAMVSAVSLGAVDTMLAKLRYSSGLTVEIEGGWYAPERPFSAGFKITGEQAALTFEDGKLNVASETGVQSIEVPQSLGYAEQIEYFVTCCTTNATPQICPPMESARAVKLALLLKQSRDQNGKEFVCEL
jgi:predicted dehydrogenase